MTELEGAAVNVRGGDVVLKFTVTDDLPHEGHWTLSTTFTAGERGPVDQVGFKSVDGQLLGAWSFDHSGGVMQRNYPDMPDTMGKTWKLVIGRDAVRSDHGTWCAALDVNGEDRGIITGTY